MYPMFHSSSYSSSTTVRTGTAVPIDWVHLLYNMIEAEWMWCVGQQIC
jgi:hypothetical protein